jgi:VanZ family protein
MYVIAGTLWTIAIAVLSLMSADQVSSIGIWDIAGIDKVSHLLSYLLHTFLWCMAVRNRKIPVYFVVFFSASFGIIMEICQFYLFNGRTFELFDVMANILGSVSGVILFKKYIN